MKMDTEGLKTFAKTVSMLSVDGVQKANSGHPGLPMGASFFASLLFSRYLKFNPKDPEWIGRDRFVLSAGHGSMLLYSLLHLFGYELSMEELKNFRQWGSITPGHPEYGMTPGVEATTGPLGQGAGNAVGLALHAKMLGANYSPELFNSKVFALVSDGDLMEGIAAEAASIAGHLGLSNLIYLYDDNKISLAGETSVCFTESVAKRFESYNWAVHTVDAYDEEALTKALDAACAETSRPTIICCRSIIGYGSPKKANNFEVHGSPLGGDEVKATKESLNWPLEPTFHIPEDASRFATQVLAEKVRSYDEWQNRFKEWSSAHPEKARTLEAQVSRVVTDELRKELAEGLGHSKKEATRSLSGKAIQVIAKHLPYFVGGSADLEPSTKTLIKDGGEIQAERFSGRNIRFGVREHAMGAMVNGLAYTKSWLPYSATFLVFSDYMRASMRLAALSHIQSLFIFTHDSFWVGEDGPTHEPIEHLWSLRIIPNLYVYRPADGVEVGMCYYSALSMKDRPSALVFTRQDLPPLPRPDSFDPSDIMKGAYVVKGSEEDTLVMIATGSEVALALDAASLLEGEGHKVRVVSMPCVELYRALPKEEKERIIPSRCKRVTIEAGITPPWAGVVGGDALHIGIDHYGASAPGELLAEKFGFSPSAVASKVKEWLA